MCVLTLAGGPGTKWELYKRFGKMESEAYKLQRTYASGMPGAPEITRIVLARNAMGNQFEQ